MSLPTDLREVPISDEIVFKGLLFEISRVKVTLPNGKTSMRDVVRHKGGVAIVPVDDDGNVTLVRQHRIAPDEMLLEIPAGKLDTWEEDPLSAARRELEEECGLRAAQMRLLTVMIPTPGYCTERLHIYLATGLTHCSAHLDADEFLSVVQMPFAEAVALAGRGELCDGKSALGLLLASRILQQENKGKA